MAQNSGLWNFPTRGGTNSDALVGHQPNHWIPIRPGSRREATAALQNPVFSACTMPFIIITDWPYNMGEVYAQLACISDVLFRQKQLIDTRATLVLATPAGLGMTPFHHVLMSPYSQFPAISFDELSQRREPGERVAWSADGAATSCFERAVLCKFHGFAQQMAQTARVLLKHIGPHLPPDPLGFSPAGVPVAADSTLRVVLEARTGASRTIRNMHQVVDACEAANRAGFQAGSFNRISCRILQTADTPAVHGTQRFYANVASVRAAHLLVTVHGAGAANCFFLEECDGGTALMEIRPCRFGSVYAGWPDAYMRHQLAWAGDLIRFFAYNVEDPAQCAPSDYEAEALAAPGTPLRGNPEMRARDQHLTLRPDPFVAYLRHAGSLLRNASAWQEASRTGTLHGYPVPGGLVLGPLGVRNLTEYLATGGGRVIPV